MRGIYTDMNRLKGLGIALAALTLWSWSSNRVEAVAPAGFVDASTFGFATNPYVALQAAINTGRDVYVPNVGTWSLERPVFMLNDNQEVLFGTGVTVEAMAGTFTDNFDSLFEINDRKNVTLRAETAGSVTLSMALTAVEIGGQKAGIRVGNSQNVKIQGLTINNPAGDGIVVGDSPAGFFSRDVTIQDVTIDGSYRNGITVTGVDGLLIDNTVIVNTTGAPAGPEVGIDFEPNDTATQPIANVVIRDTIIADNGGVFALGGAGIIWSVPNISGGVQSTGLVENVTSYSNESHGLTFNAGTLPGWVVRDSLIGENDPTGFSSFGGGPNFFVTNTAFWDSTSIQTNPVSGNVMLGAGNETGVTPVFLSTTFGNPNYMVLDLNNNPPSILAGASDGGYLGARAPAAALGAATGAIPEPTSAVLLGLAAMSMLVVARKRRLTSGMVALAILFSLVGSSTPAHATSHGELLAYWNFDELGDTADAKDSIGERNAVLMGNATRTAGPTGFGRALDLDGTVGTFADVGIQPALSLLGLEYTVAYWAKPTAMLPTAGPQRMINMDDGNNFSAGYSFGFFGANFQLSVGHNNGSNNNSFIAGATFAEDVWNHYAITYDFADTGSERKIYKDGNLVDTTAVTGGSILYDEGSDGVDAPDPLWFGAIPVHNQNFEGSLDDIRLYSNALTSTEIMALTTATPFPTVFAASDFNDSGFVNGVDLAAWETGFGQFSTSVAKSDGDANQDQRVDGRDFLRWQRQYTGGSPLSAATSNVPEPSTAVLLGLALVGLVAGGRRRR